MTRSHHTQDSTENGDMRSNSPDPKFHTAPAMFAATLQLCSAQPMFRMSTSSQYANY